MNSTKANPLSSRLALKLTVLLACLLSVILLICTFVAINLSRRQADDSAIVGTERFTDTLNRSAHYSMMKRKVEALHAMINAVGKQKDIEWVRILNKEGKITYSTNEAEVGTVVDKRAEACYQCHQAEAPLEHLNGAKRSRVFAVGRDNHRVLATIEPIYNEPSCATAECHTHPENQRVLGVLDVAMSLQTTDQQIHERTLTMAGVGSAVIALVCVAVAFFTHRFVGRPVRNLLTGTKKIGGGDFAYRIPLSGNDELSELGASFNTMSESLGKAYTELRDLATSLEQRTRELHSAQLQVVRAEKLAALGRMAAGVAHELNNPLTGVLTFAHLAARKLPKDSQEHADLEVVIHETNRCSKIIKDLLQFARESQANRKPENLNEIIRQTALILQPQAAFLNLRFQLNLAENLPEVVVDTAQLKQVLINILLNAAEAMGHGGDVTVETSFQEPDKVSIAITDTGCGIPQENLVKIFDPFFTTKDPGKGTGLGLAVSLKLIETHGGTIEVSSVAGKGSTFRVILPAHTPDKE